MSCWPHRADFWLSKAQKPIFPGTHVITCIKLTFTLLTKLFLVSIGTAELGAKLNSAEAFAQCLVSEQSSTTNPICSFLTAYTATILGKTRTRLQSEAHSVTYHGFCIHFSVAAKKPTTGPGKWNLPTTKKYPNSWEGCQEPKEQEWYIYDLKCHQQSCMYLGQDWRCLFSTMQWTVGQMKLNAIHLYTYSFSLNTQFWAKAICRKVQQHYSPPARHYLLQSWGPSPVLCPTLKMAALLYSLQSRGQLSCLHLCAVVSGCEPFWERQSSFHPFCYVNLL